MTAPAHRLRTAVIGTWAIAALVLVAVSRRDIAGQRFPDPDDAMRLMQVRDWLAGQSWWDVGQHRLNGGDFPMHWSRLVDLPLAAVMLLARPFVGPAMAEWVAMVVTPLLALLSVMGLAAVLTRRVAGMSAENGAAARSAAALAAFSVPILTQLRPMRIDHHGWQIALALAGVTALAGRPSARSGAVAGAALAALLTVSLEGLPITAAIVGIVALAWAWRPERWRGATLALVWTLFGAALVLHLATRGPGLLAPACDAVSPAWLAALGVGAVGVTLATSFGQRSLAMRLSALAIGGAGAAGTVLVLAPGCLRGPFATLPPIVYRYWYLNIPEGMPAWQQDVGWAASAFALPLVGLVGAAVAWRKATGEARERWALLLGVATAAFAVSLLVIRAAGTANALAIPGAAALVAAFLPRARAVQRAGPRIAATVGVLLLAAPGAVMGALVPRIIGTGPMSGDTVGEPGCAGSWEMRALDRLPPGVVFAPVDVSPDLVAMTRHRAITGGYHRGADAIRRVFEAFTGSPAQAAMLVREARADYLAVCPGLPEAGLYRMVAPNGFWARLDRGERFDWLQPVPMPGSPVRVWRVVAR